MIATLVAYDEHLNMILKGVEERNGDIVRQIPMLYMRGDAVLMVGRPKKV